MGKFDYIRLRINGQEFDMSKDLYDNFNHLKAANRQDWDFKILISGDGMTRTGKSTMAFQIGSLVDPSITLDRVIFSGEKLIEKSQSVGKHKALIYDEAKEGLDSKKTIQSYSQRIVDYFTQCGWMNQYLIIVLPDFFDLNKSVALNQSICLINCRTKQFNRGYFDFYNRKDKKMLYIKGYKFKNYNAHKPTLSGVFTKFFPFDKQKYEDNKKRNQTEGNKGKAATLSKYDIRYINQRYTAMRLMMDEGITQDKIGEWYNTTKSNVSEIIRKGKIQ